MLAESILIAALSASPFPVGKGITVDPDSALIFLNTDTKTIHMCVTLSYRSDLYCWSVPVDKVIKVQNKE